MVALEELYPERRYTMHTRLSLPMHATVDPGPCMSDHANLCATLDRGQALRRVTLDTQPHSILFFSLKLSSLLTRCTRGTGRSGTLNKLLQELIVDTSKEDVDRHVG
jgi:hypothetical protein